MIDLHVHSIFSDGELIPSEIARRLESLDYEAVCIADHVDLSNLSSVIEKLWKFAEDREEYGVKVLVGVEITHVPPKLIGKVVRRAREEGAEVIVVHGETIVEPVAKGTNFAAVQEEIDILSHPGLVNEKTAELAAENGIYFEITTRRGHSLTNGYVAKIAKEFGVKLVLNTDAHSPSDFISKDFAEKVAKGCNLELEELLKNSRSIVRRKKV